MPQSPWCRHTLLARDGPNFLGLLPKPANQIPLEWTAPRDFPLSVYVKTCCGDSFKTKQGGLRCQRIQLDDSFSLFDTLETSSTSLSHIAVSAFSHAIAKFWVAATGQRPKSCDSGTNITPSSGERCFTALTFGGRGHSNLGVRNGLIPPSLSHRKVQCYELDM